MFTTGDGDRKKAVSDGSRVMDCEASASSVSKNRFGLTESLPVAQGENPFTGHISTL